MAQIIDGKATAALLRQDIAREAAALRDQGVIPTLAVILVGEDPASRVYVRNKHKACLDVGLRSIEITMPEQTDEQTLLSKIDALNRDPNVDGILVQLPLPKQIRKQIVTAAILPEKDVDAFHPENVGRLTLDEPRFQPCTPAGIMALLDQYGIAVEGRECVVVGRSNIVGKPIAALLLAANGTVTVCHSKTVGLENFTKRADILVVAAKHPHLITADMVKPGAVVIDVGINRLPDGTLAGDVDFAAVSRVASHITPVPGGVGPMTITQLLRNTVLAAKARRA